MPNIQDFAITAVAGKATVTFDQDFTISLRFESPTKSAKTLGDFTGKRGLRMSALLSILPPETLVSLLMTLAPEVLMRAASIGVDPSDKDAARIKEKVEALIAASVAKDPVKGDVKLG